MEKLKTFARVLFDADVLVAARDLVALRGEEAYQAKRSATPPQRWHFEEIEDEHARLGYWGLSVDRGDETWTFDDPIEFLAEVRRLDPHGSGSASIRVSCWQTSVSVHLYPGSSPTSRVTVSAPTRGAVEEMFEIFEAATPRCFIEPETEDPEVAPEVRPVVFIGHGHSTAWRDLKDHLADKHGIDVEAYETGSRSGHAVRDVLAQMMNRASVALLVMTGEDETGDGAIRARQNVVHEAGLFQGRLGFEKAVVLVEEGVEVFSNLHGVDEIRFPRDAISQTYGDVLAWIRRETSY